MSTISPGIGKCGDNIYDHRRREEERTESRFGGSSRPMTKIGPEITTEGRRKGDTGNAVGIWEIGLGRFGLRCGAVNVLKRTKKG